MCVCGGDACVEHVCVCVRVWVYECVCVSPVLERVFLFLWV